MRPGDLTCILSNAFFVCKDGVDKNKMKKNMREPFDGGWREIIRAAPL